MSRDLFMRRALAELYQLLAEREVGSALDLVALLMRIADSSDDELTVVAERLLDALAKARAIRAAEAGHA